MLRRSTGLAGATAIEIRLATIVHAIGTLGTLAKQIGADLIFAVGVGNASLTCPAWTTRWSTTIHVSLLTVLHLVIALRQFADTIRANSIGAIAPIDALFSKQTGRTNRAAAVDVRLVLILQGVVAHSWNDDYSASSAAIGRGRARGTTLPNRSATILDGRDRSCTGGRRTRAPSRHHGATDTNSGTPHGRRAALSLTTTAGRPSLSANGALCFRHVIVR